MQMAEQMSLGQRNQSLATMNTMNGKSVSGKIPDGKNGQALTVSAVHELQEARSYARHKLPAASARGSVTCLLLTVVLSTEVSFHTPAERPFLCHPSPNWIPTGKTLQRP